MRFYLGTHEPTWLGRSHVPLFVSAVRLRARCKRKLPRAACPWALDSGGFSVLDTLGHYPTTNREYAAEVRRWSDEIGNLDWAAVQDWMCEERILARTGLTIAEHQRRTVESFTELRSLNTGVPFVPVLQGYTLDDYRRCLELYDRAGHDLRALPTVGIGSVCRRQTTDTQAAARIVHALAAEGLQLHAFGFKLDGLAACRSVLASADSLAWSDGARKEAQAERVRRRRQAGPSLFDLGEPARLPDQNGARDALTWLNGVRVAGGMTEEAGQALCPFCDSPDVHPPLSDLLSCCVNCGESWGDISRPALP